MQLICPITDKSKDILTLFISKAVFFILGNIATQKLDHSKVTLSEIIRQ